MRNSFKHVDSVFVCDNNILFGNNMAYSLNNQLIDTYNDLTTLLNNLEIYPHDTKIVIDCDFKSEQINSIGIVNQLNNLGYINCYLCSSLRTLH